MPYLSFPTCLPRVATSISEEDKYHISDEMELMLGIGNPEKKTNKNILFFFLSGLSGQAR